MGIAVFEGLRQAHDIEEGIDPPFELEATDLLGRCFQHEIDHLHGRLFLDKLSMLKRRSAMQKWEKLKSTYPGFIRKVVPGEFDDDKEDTL